MKLLIICLLTLGLAAMGALFAREDSGYVLIGYGSYTVESSLLLLIMVLGALFVAFYAGLRLLHNILATPNRLKNWFAKQSANRARNLLNRGLQELSEGDWKKAEKHLLSKADHSDTPLLNYLAAARSAQQQEAYDRRDHYLQLAHTNVPSADVAVGLTQAELQMAHNQSEQALATLQHLREIAPRHTHVLKLLKTLYQQLEDWQQLRDLLPELRKRKVIIEAEEMQALEIAIFRGLLNLAASEDDDDQLLRAWDSIPRGLKANESLVACYAYHMVARGKNDLALTHISQAIDKQWSQRLVEFYGQTEASNIRKQLSTAEGWIGRKPGDAVMLLTLGRLCLRCKLWGKARTYLESSISHNPTSAAYRELGALLEQLGEQDKAMESYRSGLELHIENPTLKLQPVKEPVVKEVPPLAEQQLMAKTAAAVA